MLTRNLWLGVWMAGLAMASSQEQVPPFLAPPPTPPGPVADGPRIQFATPVYDFGRIKSGDTAKYSFVFTNIGDQTLELTHVQPSCGCTAAGDWTRKVEPGQTGTIPIQFNSANFNGPVLKTVSVNCNDKRQPTTILQVKGTIWKPIDFSPAYSILNISPDAQSASTTVFITNNLETPLEVSSPSVNNPVFTAELQTNVPGKAFQVKITAKGPFPQSTIQGRISVQTSATNFPTLEIPLWANIQPAVMVVPPQLMLPAGALTAKTTPSITIQNNSTNQLTLSDAAVNVAGVEVELKEMQPGRIYSALLTFPAGFEIPAGQQVLFTAKSSNPNFPFIKVPVLQLSRPFVRPPALPTPTPVASPPTAPPKPTAKIAQ